jgi:hypothetical protein
LKLAAVIDGEIVHVFALNKKESFEFSSVSGKMVLIKAAGESAEFDITVTREFIKP